jgi:hypothetical protein
MQALENIYWYENYVFWYVIPPSSGEKYPED